LARINVLTLSKSPMTFLLSNGRKIRNTKLESRIANREIRNAMLHRSLLRQALASRDAQPLGATGRVCERD
jgi:hypothetical protein